MPAPSSNSVRWMLLASLPLLAVLWLLVGCGAPTQEGQQEHQQEVMRPIEGEFVGEVPRLEAFIALVALEPQEQEEEEREVRGYLSDGRQLNEWFTTTVSGDVLQGSGDSGIQLYATLAPELTIGTIVLPNGESSDFQIPQASGIEGVYPLIVPPEGGELSSTSWSGARLAGERDGEEIIGTITIPDNDAEASGFGFSVAATDEGADRWIVVIADDGQPRIKGAKIAGD